MAAHEAVAHEGAWIVQLVAMGVLVRVLGGLSGPVEDGLDVRVNVADLTTVKVALSADIR